VKAAADSFRTSKFGCWPDDMFSWWQTHIWWRTVNRRMCFSLTNGNNPQLERWRKKRTLLWFRRQKNVSPLRSVNSRHVRGPYVRRNRKTKWRKILMLNLPISI
jgi:hypothetical protein